MHKYTVYVYLMGYYATVESDHWENSSYMENIHLCL